MLTINIPAGELFNEENNTFVYIKECSINLEHSLISISKWESVTHEYFLDDSKPKTEEQMKLYIKCMSVGKELSDELIEYISSNGPIIMKIKDYIEDPRSATKFYKHGGEESTSKELTSSETIYYCMTAYNIPFECEKWHINRLLNLIRICNIKNGTGKKMSKTETVKSMKEINEERKRQLGTLG